MLLSLLVQTAYAGQFSMALGLGAGGGAAGDESWSTVAPVTTVGYMLHLAFLEGYVGGSSSLLMARQDQTTVPVALAQGEVGLGLGGRAFGVGLFWGAGLGGTGGGLYSHLTFPGRGWVRRMGVEGRLVGYPETNTAAAQVLWRIEPGRRRTPPPHEVVPPPPAYPPEQAPVAVPLAVPVDEPPPAEPAEPPPVHHDDPYTI